MQRTIRYRLAVGLACMIVFILPCIGSAAPQAASMSAQKTSLPGTVRVYLSSIAGNTTLSLTIDGTYSINGDASRPLTKGGTAKVSFESGRLYLTIGGAKQDMGQQFFLRRHTSSGINGIKIAQSASPSSWYNGDLEFAVRNNRMYPIAHVEMEQYIYGVLPYEMSNSFPLEALKAQAVAARTYTVQAMAKKAAYYDVVDTTADQVYRGIGSGNDRCKQAADETGGVVGMYNGQYMGGYYTASNGGQTEAAKNAWGGSAYPYLSIQDDPYDLANSASVKRSYTVSTNGSVSSALASQLQSKAATALYASAGELSIASITDVTVHTPKYAVPSRVYTKVDFSMQVWKSAADKQNGVTTNATVTMDYFADLEPMLGTSINSMQNELITVERNGNQIALVSRRYGHGVGMSQRGAQQMANQGFSFREIIGFYFPGTTLVQYTFSGGSTLPELDPDTVPEVTPAPQVPVAPSQSVAYVSLKNPSEWLNLRKGPGTDTSVLAQLAHGQAVQVLTSDGVWCQVQYGSLTGYVMQSYLTFEQSGTPVSPETTLAPTPAPNEEGEAKGRVIVMLKDATSKLNLRKAANTSSSIVTRLSHGAVLEVLRDEGAWLMVRYGFSQGYVSAAYVSPWNGAESSPTPAPNAGDPSAQPQGFARVALSPGSTLNLRQLPSMQGKVLRAIPADEIVSWSVYNEEWAHVTYQNISGYAMRMYLAPVADAGEASPTPELMPSPTPAPQASTQQTKFAVIVLSSANSKLNMRAGANSGAKVLLSVPHGEVVEVIQYASDWCEAEYHGVRGFLSTAFLLFQEEAGGAKTTTPTTIPTTAPTTGSTQAPPVQGYELIVTATRLNLRLSANTGSKILAELPYGTRVKVLEQLVDWYMVEWGNIQGYLSADYVRPVDASTPATPQPSPTPIGAHPTTQPELTATPAPTPAPTAAPTADPGPAAMAEGTYVGKAKSLLGQASIQAYEQPNLSVPCWAILAGDEVMVRAYEGANEKWYEVQYGDAIAYVLRTEMTLDKAVAID